jgi:hypothetical protein
MRAFGNHKGLEVMYPVETGRLMTDFLSDLDEAGVILELCCGEGMLAGHAIFSARKPNV